MGAGSVGGGSGVLGIGVDVSGIGVLGIGVDVSGIGVLGIGVGVFGIGVRVLVGGLCVFVGRGVDVLGGMDVLVG